VSPGADARQTPATAGGVRPTSDSQGMALSTHLERPRVVIVQVAIGALILVLVLVVIASDEHQPHVELAPPPVSVAMPPVPVASGAVAPDDPTWHL